MTRLLLTSQSRQQAGINRWLGSGRDYLFTRGEQQGVLHIASVSGKPDGLDCMFFRCTAGTLAMVDPLPLIGLLADCPALPGEVASSDDWYWHYLNQQLSPEIAQLLGGLWPQPCNSNSNSNSNSDIWLQMTVTLADQQARTLLRVPVSVLAAWQQQPGWQPRRIAIDPALPLILPLNIGKLTLSMQRCRQLAAGDLLFPSQGFFTPEGEGVIYWGRNQFTVRMEPVSHSAYTGILHITLHKELTMTYPNDPLSGESEPGTALDEARIWQEAHSDSFDDLPLELSVRCGNLRLTLGELQQLGAGSTLLVEHVTPGEALLCHGNYLLAKGELVNVNGTLGLQIISMLGQSGKMQGQL